eukprot:SAG31_NODE_94_length_26208_cov_6.281091_4_plen_137_part_00
MAVCTKSAPTDVLHIHCIDVTQSSRCRELNTIATPVVGERKPAVWSCKPVEQRTLFHSSSSQINRGKLELWVEILTQQELDKTPKWDISKDGAFIDDGISLIFLCRISRLCVSFAEPEEWELRVVVWGVRGAPHMV